MDIEKNKKWLARINSAIRFQGEYEDDEFSFFSNELYQQWKEEEPNIDEILDYVIFMIDREYMADGEVEEEINERLGRKMK